MAGGRQFFEQNFLQLWNTFHTRWVNIQAQIPSNMCQKVVVNYIKRTNAATLVSVSHVLSTFKLCNKKKRNKLVITTLQQDYWPIVNFIHKWKDIQLKVDSERQIFSRSFSWQFYLRFRVIARILLRGNQRRNTFCILFWCLAWGSSPGF